MANIFPSKISSIDSLLTLNIQQTSSSASIIFSTSDTRYITINGNFTYAIISISYLTGSSMYFNWTFTSKLENGVVHKAENITLYDNNTYDIIVEFKAQYNQFYCHPQNAHTMKPSYSLGIGLFL